MVRYLLECFVVCPGDYLDRLEVFISLHCSCLSPPRCVQCCCCCWLSTSVSLRSTAWHINFTSTSQTWVNHTDFHLVTWVTTFVSFVRMLPGSSMFSNRCNRSDSKHFPIVVTTPMNPFESVGDGRSNASVVITNKCWDSEQPNFVRDGFQYVVFLASGAASSSLSPPIDVLFQVVAVAATLPHWLGCILSPPPPPPPTRHKHTIWHGWILLTITQRLCCGWYGHKEV